MSAVVGMLHLKCNLSSCQHVYAVDAHKYLIEFGNIAYQSDGSYSYPKRYCPMCERKAKTGGYPSEREQDERIAKMQKKRIAKYGFGGGDE